MVSYDFLGIFKQRESFCNIYQEICKKITYTKEIKFKKKHFPHWFQCKLQYAIQKYYNSKGESLSFNKPFKPHKNFSDQTCNLLDIKYDSYG